MSSTNPNENAKAAVEKAFADAVGAKSAAMLSSSNAITDPTTAATNSLIHLRDVRSGWLAAIRHPVPASLTNSLDCCPETTASAPPEV